MPKLAIRMNLALSSGRIGQLLALSITFVAPMVAWFAIADPLLDYYSDRADQLVQQRVLAQRMKVVAQTIPELRQASAQYMAQQRASSNLFEGETDAIAAAALQQWVQNAASQIDARLLSTEALPATSASVDRRISVHVAVSASWPVLIKLLQAIEQATQRMLIDDLQIHERHYSAQPLDSSLSAEFTIVAFCFRSAPEN